MQFYVNHSVNVINPEFTKIETKSVKIQFENRNVKMQLASLKEINRHLNKCGLQAATTNGKAMKRNIKLAMEAHNDVAAFDTTKDMYFFFDEEKVQLVLLQLLYINQHKKKELVHALTVITKTDFGMNTKVSFKSQFNTTNGNTKSMEIKTNLINLETRGRKLIKTPKLTVDATQDQIVAKINEIQEVANHNAMVAEQERIEDMQREYAEKKKQYETIQNLLVKATKQQSYAKEELANMEIDMLSMGVAQ
ncbi:hypothetical protein E4185_16755 [Aeromonas media]|uniref:hypothetical protein n=1 Tax=Aeromonas media TaxID=651 RepID=UPI00148B0BD9|nr:hypothetical protein [Aeromonas media]QJT27550.1 hypothetical protein E4185_16755 [Aeromonas media]